MDNNNFSENNKDWNTLATTGEHDANSYLLQALKEKQERDNPKPLTIAELKQMKGEPVWVQGSYYRDEISCWEILVGVGTGHDPNLCHFMDYSFSIKDYSKIWVAYAHKPKEDK